MAVLLLKKEFLDKFEDPNLTQLSAEQIQELIINLTIDDETQPWSLIKRKAEILAKAYKKINQLEQLVALVSKQMMNNEASMQTRRSSMYMM